MPGRHLCGYVASLSEDACLQLELLGFTPDRFSLYSLSLYICNPELFRYIWIAGSIWVLKTDVEDDDGEEEFACCYGFYGCDRDDSGIG
ncbi:unnamed protein product [Camellia sinensis]